jgi:hypothetical protein
MEHLVEGGEEASKELVDDARDTVLGRAVALEQQCGERGRQRERVEAEITVEIAMVIANCL